MPSIRRDISSSAIRRESSPPPLEVTEKREYPLSRRLGEAGVDAGGQQIVVKMHQVADGSAPVSLQRRGGLIGNVAQGAHGFFDAPALFRADIAPCSARLTVARETPAAWATS